VRYNITDPHSEDLLLLENVWRKKKDGKEREPKLSAEGP
jgi:hypothetical protein